MERLREANGIFAINLLKMLGEEDRSRNVFFSPLSVSSALAMVFMGAKGDTAAQMAQVGAPIAKGKPQSISLCASSELVLSRLQPADDSSVAGLFFRLKTLMCCSKI